MRPVVLIGIKHCGKSTLGRLLAGKYKCPFCDSDSELEKVFHQETGSRCSVREIFRILGEEKFREFEARVIRTLISDEFRVISLGGGAAANPFLDAQSLHRLGVLLWLNTADAVAYKRVIKNGLPPFLADAEDPEKKFIQMNEKRRQGFACIADVVFEIDREWEKDEAVNAIAALLEGKLS